MKRRSFRIFALFAIVALMFGLTGAVFAAPARGDTCPEGQHWDEETQQCVDDEEEQEATSTAVPTDEPTAEPTAEPDPTDVPEHNYKMDVCHKDGQSGNYSLVNVSINSVDGHGEPNGHGNHEGDSWAAQDNEGTEYDVAAQGDFPGGCAHLESTPTPRPPGNPPSHEPKTGPEASLPIGAGIAFLTLAGLAVGGIRRINRKS